MEFCHFCNNMLYIKDDPDDAFDVKLYCKNCQFQKPLSDSKQTKLVIQNIYNANNVIDYKNILNENIIHDPTIPHIDNIKCPNEGCTKPKDAGNDILYIKIDTVNLKFIYYCTYCKQFWENNLKKN